MTDLSKFSKLFIIVAHVEEKIVQGTAEMNSTFSADRYEIW